MALLYGVPPRQVLVGRGSDEAIDLLVRAFCRAGQDSVVITPPTFGLYKVAARIQGAARARSAAAARSASQLDADAVIAAGRRAKLVFLCSPNNPTGNLLDEAGMLRVCDATARTGAGRASTRPTSSSRAARAWSRASAEFPNLVILRTLSKAYALAGARLGTLLASEEIVGLLRRIIPPYAIPASTVEEVLALTEAPQRALCGSAHRTLLAEREQHARARSTQLPGRRASATRRTRTSCWSNAAIRSVFLERRQGGRPDRARLQRRTRRSRNCLRISVGTPEQNERLLGRAWRRS